MSFRLYLVGGAVRDMLLGREPVGREFVAVGARPRDIRAAFPLATRASDSFIVPGLGEIGLARIERAAGAARGNVVAGPWVTLEQDLERRDLTINAMALEVSVELAREGEVVFAGGIIDPHAGQRDLADGVLRHVGPAFAEDPLRVYRVARLAAQLGFRVAPETMAVMCAFAWEHIDPVPDERVAREIRLAAMAPYALEFERVLAAARDLAHGAGSRPEGRT